MIWYIVVAIVSGLAGYIGGFLFGSLHGARFAHKALKQAGRLKELPPPTKVNQDFQ